MEKERIRRRYVEVKQDYDQVVKSNNDLKFRVSLLEQDIRKGKELQKMTERELAEVSCCRRNRLSKTNFAIPGVVRNSIGRRVGNQPPLLDDANSAWVATDRRKETGVKFHVSTALT